MNISSFSRMEPFRKDGRLAVILKLSLPCLLPEEMSAKTFNSLYTSLAEEYRRLCRAIAERTEYIRPVTVTVSFEEITEKREKSYARHIARCRSPLVIRRLVRINVGGKVNQREHTDFFDLERGIFVK